MIQPTGSAARRLDHTHAGDCHQLLRQMHHDGVQVQMRMPRPPYFGLRSDLPDDHPDKHLEIGRQISVQEYIRDLVAVFRLVGELLADDGTLWLSLGDSPNARPGQRKGSDKAGMKQRTVRRSVAAPSRHVTGLNPKGLIGNPWAFAFALHGDSWYLRQDIIWAKANPMRESVADRCTRSHEYLILPAKKPRYDFDHEAIRESSTVPSGPGNIRPFSTQLGERMSSGNADLRGSLQQIGARDTRDKRTVWSSTNKPLRCTHFAMLPENLVTPCTLAGSGVSDTVFDPFMGSGTTAEAALCLLRQFIDCELNRSFIDP